MFRVRRGVDLGGEVGRRGRLSSQTLSLSLAYYSCWHYERQLTLFDTFSDVSLVCIYTYYRRLSDVIAAYG